MGVFKFVLKFKTGEVETPVFFTTLAFFYPIFVPRVLVGTGFFVGY